MTREAVRATLADVFLERAIGTDPFLGRTCSRPPSVRPEIGRLVLHPVDKESVALRGPNLLEGTRRSVAHRLSLRSGDALGCLVMAGASSCRSVTAALSSAGLGHEGGLVARI